MAKPEMLTKEQFCELTHTSENCWMFNEDYHGPNPGYWRYRNKVYYDNDKDELRCFKIMGNYGEVWSSVKSIDEKGDFSSGWSI